MNVKVVAGVLLVMLVTATGTVAAAQYSTTRQNGLSMVHTYSSDDSDAGRIVLYTVKPGTYPQIQRGDAFIPGRGIIIHKSVTEKRNVYVNRKHVVKIDNQRGFYEKKRSSYDPSAPAYVPGEFLVTFNPGVSEDAIEAINKKYGVSVKRTSPFVPEDKVLSVPQDKTVEEMVQLYEGCTPL